MIHCFITMNHLTQIKLCALLGGSSILIRLSRLITFQAAQNTVALDMANRIIKSLLTQDHFDILYIGG